MSDTKIKILITAFDFYPNTGGVATYAWELAESLGKQGFDVLVLAKNRKKKEKESLFFKVQYIDLPQAGLLAFPELARHICKLIWTWKPEKIISTLWMPGGVAAVIAKVATRKKIDIYTVVHAMEVIESDKTFKKRLRAKLSFLKFWTFRKLTKVICISQYSRQLVLKHTNCEPDKTVIVHNGVNPDKFRQFAIEESTLNRWDNTYPLLLTIGRLVPHKGIDSVLKALPRLIETHPMAQYLIGGSGPDRERLEKIVRDLDLSDHVTFLGHVDENDLAKYYSMADLFVLLSREEFPNVEGFGLVFLEAAACQTPSLGGKSGGIPDAILDQKTGWLVDPNDIDRIVNKFLEIFSHPKIVEDMGLKARDYTLQNRSWDHVGHQFIDHMFGGK